MRFSKSKINESRKGLYDIKTQRNLSAPEIKEIEENLHELEESLFKFKKYHDRDDEIKYFGIRYVTNLFDHYYKPIKIKSAFIDNYIDENLSPEEYLNMIRPYLSDMINDHKTSKIFRVHSRNEAIDYKTQFGKWKI